MHCEQQHFYENLGFFSRFAICLKDQMNGLFFLFDVPRVWVFTVSFVSF